MFSRATNKLAKNRAPLMDHKQVFELPKRYGGVNLKDLKSRLEAVKSIQKVTESMKQLASAKVRKSEIAVHRARTFAAPMVDFWPVNKQEVTKETPFLLVAVTADRGLCGSVNTSIVRKIRQTYLKKAAEGHTFNLIVLGEKGRGSLEKIFNQQFAASIAEANKPKVPNFKQVTEILNTVLSQKFDAGEVIYNQYKNAVSFSTIYVPIQSFEVASKDNPALAAYTELEGGEDILQNLYEFKLAVQFFLYLAELECTENSSRVSAMTSAGKAASDMISSIQIVYQRTRQGKVTGELCEIVSGAVGLEEGEQ